MSHSLLHAIAGYVAGRTGLIWEGGDDERQLYTVPLPERSYIATAINFGSAISRAGTPTPVEPYSIQIMTRGAGNVVAAIDRAQLVYEAFLDDHRLPIRHVQLSAEWKLLECDPLAPQSIGLDEKQRAQYVSNVTMRVVKLS